jgi:hypothetical protein
VPTCDIALTMLPSGRSRIWTITSSYPSSSGAAVPVCVQPVPFRPLYFPPEGPMSLFGRPVPSKLSGKLSYQLLIDFSHCGLAILRMDLELIIRQQVCLTVEIHFTAVNGSRFGFPSASKPNVGTL